VKNEEFVEGFLKKHNKKEQINTLYKSMSFTEKLMVSFLALIFILSSVSALLIFNQNFLKTVPTEGGKLIEATIGTPRFVNPLLATSQTDRDLTTLIYSGLTRTDSNGEIILDLVERFEISEDEKEYTFYLKENMKFHDGTPLTAEDVIFTVQKIQDPEIKSNKRSNWEGVSVSKIDDKTILFELNQPYAPFLQETSIGILPKHIWQNIDTSDFSFNLFNIEPIGSGPFKVKTIKRNELNIIESYSLSPFKDFALGSPFLSEITFVFVRTQEEIINKFNKGEINSIHGLDPQIAKNLLENNVNVSSFSLSRIFGIFFNQDKANVLADSNVRKALDLITPRDEIISEILFDFGEKIDSPIPSSLKNKNQTALENSELSYAEKLEEAKNILIKGGWEKNEDGVWINNAKKQMLAFEISIPEVNELVQVANKITNQWKEFGANVSVRVYDSSEFSSNVIRPRNYDSILFAIIIGKPSDLYAFWHSSQRNDPGLNISGYTNIDVDRNLVQLRNTTDLDARQELITKIESEIKKDIPAIFLYSPKYIYVLPKNMFGIEINNLINSNERFNTVYKWYVKTDKIFKFLSK
jgi:peptide/nickel transport system substrate-binding protein